MDMPNTVPQTTTVEALDDKYRRAAGSSHVNYAFFFGATNDSWAKAPIGEFKYDHFTKEDLKTFRPAMARMLEWMTNRYINTDIYFILNSELSEEVTSSAKSLCERYHVKCIELHDIHKLSGHPSIKGMQQIAEQVSAAVK